MAEGGGVAETLLAQLWLVVWQSRGETGYRQKPAS